MFFPLLDRLLFRHPFEGNSARRYARDERPAFGDLDDRLLDRLPLVAGDAVTGVTLLDVGCGPLTFARRARARFPSLRVIAVDPSNAIGAPDATDAGAGGGGLTVVRAAGEALPLADRSIDVAICLSSIRHVRDRAATFSELRRVVRGTLAIVELDPSADARRIANHADHLGSALLRAAFGPLVCKTAPPSSMIEQLAIDAGWAKRSLTDDPTQPVYVLELQ